MIRLPDLGRLGASYALHVDVVMTPSGPLRDAVVRIDNGRLAEIAAADAYANPAVPALHPRRCAGAGHARHPPPHHRALRQGADRRRAGSSSGSVLMPLEAAATAQSVYAGLEVDLPGSLARRHHHHRRSRYPCARADGGQPSRCRRYWASGLYPRPAPTTSRTTPPRHARPTHQPALMPGRRRHGTTSKTARPSIASIRRWACGTVQSNSKDMIKALSQFCRDEDILFQIHANEHTLEVHASIESFDGARSNCCTTSARSAATR